MMTLVGQGRFSDYDFDDALVKRVYEGTDLQDKERLEKAREELRERIMSQNREYEEFVNKILARMSQLYADPRFESVGFTFFNTDIPEAIVLYNKDDDSYAVGVDYGMIAVFQFTFSAFLRAWLNMLGPKGWMQPFLDIFKFQYFGRDEATIARMKSQLSSELRLEHVSPFALPMTFQFVIAHELAHLHLGHFKKNATTRIDVVPSDVASETACVLDREAEFEADAWAAIAVQKMAGRDVIQQMLARHIPSLYLSVLSLVKMLYVPGTSFGKRMEDSHPDAWERAKRLRPKEDGLLLFDEVTSAIGNMFWAIERERRSRSFRRTVRAVKKRIANAEKPVATHKRPWWKFWTLTAPGSGKKFPPVFLAARSLSF
jgi:hypothetical protein